MNSNLTRNNKITDEFFTFIIEGLLNNQTLKSLGDLNDTKIGVKRRESAEKLLNVNCSFHDWRESKDLKAQKITLYLSNLKEQEIEKNLKQSSILYFANKLQKRFGKLKRIMNISYGILVLDIILIVIIPKVFMSKINIISLSIIIIFNIFCNYIFRHNFEIVTYWIYRSVVRSIYSLVVIVIVYYGDMFYTLLFSKSMF